jgi:hypothetical protein
MPTICVEFPNVFPAAINATTMRFVNFVTKVSF